MATRMDKYHSQSTTPVQSRSQKNQNLYTELYTNKVYTDFSNIQIDNVIDLDHISKTITHGTREDFQKSRLLNSESSNMRPNRDYSTFTKESISFDMEDKSYNINDVLEDARKNRTESSEDEKKRHLKTVEYNILSDLNQEKLKQYHDKKKQLSKKEEENLEELINTITSNSLRKKIDDELFSELLPTEEEETLVSEEMLQELQNEKTLEKEMDTEDEEEEMDKSFYTKSMDLSEEDFELGEEDRSFVEDKGMSLSKKIFLLLLVLVVLIVIGYIIFRFI